jgi:chromosome condensin MukBEF MukE localization factor
MSIRKMAVGVDKLFIIILILDLISAKSLASYHNKRFEELDAALRYAVAVVSAAKSDGHASLPHYLEALAMFHSLRYDRTG